MAKVLLSVIGISILLWGGLPDAHGQKATEMFIPVGQSPGLSGRYTVIGRVETVNAKDRTVTIVGSSGTRTASMTSRTQIWLDRSKLRLSNQKGTLADLRKGLTVEVKYVNGEKEKGVAEWIKVELTESPGKR
ncbi:MAG: hypothetical protein L0214_12240 [candidate division NC10 bacterium]|nr:hypothetical protein [candidate division NC10 bacterium]